MNADPQQAKAIFLQAVEKHDPDQWAAFLDQACAGQPMLRRRVELLLEAHREAGTAAHQAGDQCSPSHEASAGAEQRGSVIGPYKLLEPIGEGGMGMVWMAQQTEPVKRVVALKLIKAGMDSKQVIARFEAERQALALMDHANIARVLDGGRTDAGRPYFVMDLVKGVPITRHCDEHHLTPRQRLELFIPVCQAIQHAHQKGIIHRDLKPSNVLVALYDGKPVPKVIDFGVAKAAGQPLTDKTLVTGFGNIVGTLEYMSPEQAEINQLDIDTRSDIYSLGVLLYELLAGSPPFTRKDLEKAGMLEMLRVIREQEPSKPSTKLSTAEGLPTLAANRGTEPAKLTRLVRGELDWIVMKALEKDRSRRYETANGFAMDVRRYLADEAVLACPPSVGYRFRKFARRNKVGLAVAGLILFFLTLLGAGAGWVVRDREAREQEVARDRAARLAVTHHLADDAIHLADRHLRQGDWIAAREATKRAEGLLDSGASNEEYQQRLRDLLTDLDMVARLEEIRLEKAQVKDEHFDNAAAELNYERAFRDYGIDVQALSVKEAAELIGRRAIRSPLLAALDDWARVAPTKPQSGRADWQHLRAVARLADPDPLRAALWEALARGNKKALLEMADGYLRDLDLAPATLVSLARDLCRAKAVNKAEAVLRKAQQHHPDDFWINHDLAHCLHVEMRPARPLEAVRFYTAAAALRPRSPGVLVNLGSALSSSEKHNDATVVFGRAIDLKPDYVTAWYNRGNAYCKLGQPDKAVADYSKAIELDPKFVKAWSNRGAAYSDLKKPDKAVADYSKAIELDPKFVKAWSNRGAAYSDLNKLDKAVADYSKAIELDPNDTKAWYNRGNAYAKLGQPDKAVTDYSRAIELDPKETSAWHNRGNAYRKLGQPDKAVTDYSRAIELDPKHRNAWYNRGNAYVALDQQEKAAADFSRAIELDPKDTKAWYNRGNTYHKLGQPDKAVADYSKVIELKPDLAKAWTSLGNAHFKLRQYDKAIANHSRAVELQPDYAEAWSNRGAAHANLRQYDKAIADHSTAIELKPDYADGWYNRGIAYLHLREYGKAIADHSKAIDLKPDHAEAWYNRGIAYRYLRQYDKAIANHSKAIELKPDYVEAWYNRGIAQSSLRQYDKAIADYSQAIKLKPGYAETWYCRGIAQSSLRQYDKAIADYSKAIEVKPDHAQAWSNRGNAHHNLRQYDEAIADHSKAIELKPDLAQAWTNRGLAHVRLRKYDKALVDHSKAIELRPNFASAHNNLAWLLVTCPDSKMRNPDKAVAAARKAIELEPQVAAFWRTLAAAHHRAGDWKAAITACEKSCQLRNGGDSSDWFVLAMAHWQLGNRDQARQWYHQAVQWMDKRQPNNEELGRFRTEAEQLLELKKR